MRLMYYFCISLRHTHIINIATLYQQDMHLRKYTKTMRSLMLMALMAVAMPILAQNTSDHNFRVAKNLDIFNAIYRNLDLMYVDSLDADKTIGTAIRSMMHSLDPYTDYFPEDKAAEYKQMMTGKYAGIGSIISYSFTRKRVIINEPYEGAGCRSRTEEGRHHSEH